ncbi:MAG: sodium:proton antiporter, partial [Halobacteriovorax sp.]|nr:sodium:proton antiporter [Halobacteriovorax sp.]
MSPNADKRPALLLSLVPVIFLMGLLIFNIILFKDDATGGPNQLALLASGALAAVIGIFVLKRPYDEIENRIVKSISMAIQATLILLVVGCLIGTWILSGVVPSMIYYGLQLIHPAVILPVSALVCAI